MITTTTESSLQKLSAEVLYNVLEFSPLFDVLSMLKVCSVLRAIGQDRMRPFYKDTLPHRTFSPWLESETIDKFRELQCISGMIVAGSVALSIFAPVSFLPNNLDCLVSLANGDKVVNFLEAHGYMRKREDGDKGTTADFVLAETAHSSSFTAFYHSNPEIQSIVAYEKLLNNNLATINIIFTSGSPVHAVLLHHSTCAMNLITHEVAMCLFPCSTMKLKKAIMLRGPTYFETNRNSVNIVAEKYKERKLTFVHPDFVTFMDALLPNSELNMFGRSPGDTMCLTLPLPPFTDCRYKSPMSVEILKAHSWSMSYETSKSVVDTKSVTTIDNIELCVSPWSWRRIVTDISVVNENVAFCWFSSLGSVVNKKRAQHGLMKTLQRWLSKNPIPITSPDVTTPNAAVADCLADLFYHLEVINVQIRGRPNAEVKFEWIVEDDLCGLGIMIIVDERERFLWNDTMEQNSASISALRDETVFVRLL
ncbi:hypothetical protein E1B28_009420 [Marasmius oreades]|uniref:F-box domain-containing protein n=1 Tax=Marasmius oreades TaxID=181124 RepID=A0A9P7UST6_9AGAR|nr:uncharacterized protein E1B28_009420 [Marasmius oreades]KAG7093137.1 hypothetical protein E1B28_009420 [Marasmius oreades]